MPGLSVAMIVRDEEASLGAVLSDAGGFCDELVVVDTGSQDGTRDVALAAGAKVLDFPWIDDFSAARNASFEACSGDWIMWLDADDRVPVEVQAVLREGKQSVLTDALDVISCPYKYHFDAVTGECTFTLPRERIVRASAGYRWAGPVHEVLDVSGARIAIRDDIYVEHRPTEAHARGKVGRNLRILQRSHASGDRSPRTLFYLGNELRDAGRHQEAIDAYAEYLTHPAPAWERYAATMSCADCADAAGMGRDIVQQHLFAALGIDSSRSEAFMALGRTHFLREEWSAARPYFAAAALAARPQEGFISEQDYTWKPWDYLGVCLINLGQHEDGIGATLKSLLQGNPDVARLRTNLHWSIDQLGSDSR